MRAPRAYAWIAAATLGFILSLSWADDAANAAEAEDGAAQTVDVNAYYFGDPENYTQPAAVDMLMIRDATPEYREIKRRKIDTDRAEYWILINKAYERIERALQRVAQYKGYDLIGEIGFVTDAEGRPVPIDNATDLVIRYLQ